MKYDNSLSDKEATSIQQEKEGKMLIRILLLSQWITSSLSSNLLLLTPPVTKYSTKSHADNLIALGKGLIKSGHQVSISKQGTVRLDNLGNISLFEISSPVSPEHVELVGEAIRNSSIDSLYQNISYIKMDKLYKVVWDAFIEDCRTMLSDCSVEERLKKFDLIVIDQYFFCGFLLVEKYKKPFVMYECSSYITYSQAAIPGPVSWVPTFLSSLTDKMTIIDRMRNIISNIHLTVVLDNLDRIFEDLKVEMKISPGKSISEIRKDAQLFLVNSDYIFEFPRPLTPNIVQVGGILASQPVDDTNIHQKFHEITIKRFGIIAFGSALDFCHHPTLLEKISNILKNFKDIHWIWSLKCQLDKEYSNIHIFKWIPQVYLLSKENCVLLISHGGLNSVYEAMYHSTPVLVLPLPADSMDNSVRFKRHGALEILPFHTKGVSSLNEYIFKMLKVKSYSESARRVSSLLNSQKPKPLEKAVYWIEHILKFGGNHLRHSAIDMPAYKLYNIDLFTIILIIFLLTICAFLTTEKLFDELSSPSHMLCRLRFMFSLRSTIRVRVKALICGRFSVASVLDNLFNVPTYFMKLTVSS
ncbi:DgyrCDS14708 [Dimorphilus gyrociliatus]|uniref:DgyrCDS14708 n=1 Tax=Dimorphilus gyrociliatus TaxID=2664684 RepID=A0A7I8WEL4_9ANNE|nr:DgyrCDS14708 [Dimorphilus gyrociliatus]